MRLYFDSQNGVVRLENPQKQFIENVVAYNMLGQTVFRAEVQNNTDESFSLNSAAGVYIIKVNMPESSITKKIIKN